MARELIPTGILNGTRVAQGHHELAAPWQRFAGRDGGDGARGIDQDRARNFLVGDEVIEEDRGGAAVSERERAAIPWAC